MSTSPIRSLRVPTNPAESMAAAIRAGFLPTDYAFDRFLPESVRSVASQFWTHVPAATLAGEWLKELGIRTVVDIGSGAGKFCVVAALRSECSFVGIEHRARLVEAARQLTTDFGLEGRISFLGGALETVAIPKAELYYLYNPFAENLFSPSHRLDEHVELSKPRFSRDTKFVERFLRKLDVGAYMLTYNGFGGCIPSSFVLARSNATLPNVLRLWQKTTLNDKELWHAPEPS